MVLLAVQLPMMSLGVFGHEISGRRHEHVYGNERDDCEFYKAIGQANRLLELENWEVALLCFVSVLGQSEVAHWRYNKTMEEWV